MQPIFYIRNQGRKKAFSIETSIFIDNGKKIAIKKSSHKDSISHIMNMANTYTKTKEIFESSNNISLVPIKKIDDETVSFDYIEGRSAERLLIDRIINGDSKGLAETVSVVIDFIESIPSVTKNPTKSDKYTSVFGNNYNYECECINPGIIDLNFDNFIINKNNIWNMFDYEWCFDFEIPKEYLIQRVLFWFFVMRYSNISLLSGNKIKIIEIGEGIYVPEIIYNKYKSSFATMQQLIEAEWSFQKYTQIAPPIIGVHGNKLNVSLYKEPLEMSADRLDEILKKQNILNDYESTKLEYKNIKTEMDVLANNHNAVVQELENIKSSRSYRYITKLKKIKNKLFNN